MNTHVHNIRKKPWFGKTMKLSELITLLQDIAEKSTDDPQVVGVHSPDHPREARVIHVVTRSTLLDELLGQQLNSLGTDVTDIDVEDMTGEMQSQLKQGEVVYIALGYADGPAASRIYTGDRPDQR